MSKVIEGVYIGGAKEASDKEWLDRRGITHVLNAAREVPNFFPGKYSYLRLDLFDHPGQMISETFHPSMTFVRSAIRENGNVLIHCYAGVSRSSTITIYALMHVMGWPFEKAYNFLKRKHPQAHPNIGFVHQLKSLRSAK